MTALQPIRFPDQASREGMTRRAWWLVLLNILLPGSVQVLAGNRRLGRFGLVATLALWIVVVAGVVLLLVRRDVLITVATNAIALTVLQVACVFFGLLWLTLTVDTLRLARLVRAAPAARPAITLLAVVVVGALVAGAGYGAVVTNSARGLVVDVFSGGHLADPVDGKYNILLLGGDAGSSRVGLRPDSISVVSVDAATGAATIIGIPRNLQRTPFPAGSPLNRAFPDGYDCGVNCLIDYLYTYGEDHPELYPDAAADSSEPGIEAMRDAASGVTGLTIQYYTLIDMGGFKDLIDALGGVKITVKERLPIGGKVNSAGRLVGVTGWIEKGTRVMSGRAALWYARSRESTSDYDRMARQREVQEALLKQFSPSTVLTKVQAVANAGTRIVKTDIPQGMLGGFVDLAEKARGHEVTQLELVPKNGVNVVFPDFDDIHARVQDTLAQAAKDAAAH
ncbi:LCP family protein [Galbitalea sp. SE-J8]|uniref:LCP family protein n=1 Tax=Galbitalea sp. SE-J8 TaxID=3054952 RepID=UPI00259CADBD|nr:LCP family protein [Galbitalea sp. SE-J8]MDM4762730.1 LCP family protein [Galbitalea sp. SE-J8]